MVTEQLEIRTIGEEIGYEKGAKFVKNYHDQNHIVIGHVIGKEILQKILNQPGVEGIRFYQGLNEGGEETLVYVGVTADGKDDYTIIADRAYMCPPYCGGDNVPEFLNWW